MATINLSYTAEQGAAVQSAVARLNRARDLSMTGDEFMQQKFFEFLSNLVTDQAALDRAEGLAAYDSATPDVKAKVKALLNIS